MADDPGSLSLIRLAPDAPVPALPAGSARPLQAALRRLAGWTRPGDLFAAAVDEGGAAAARPLLDLLAGCEAAGVLEQGVGPPDRPALTCRIAPGSGLGPDPGTGQGRKAEPPYVFVSYGILLPQPGGWRMTSPLAAGEAAVTDPDLMAALARMGDGWTPAGPLETAAARLLLRAGLLVPAAADRPDTPLSTPALWLHAASRRGSALNVVGATGRAGARDAAPARRQDPPGPAIPLPVPEPADGPGLFALLRARTSWRVTPPDSGLTAAELGTLLWHAARDRAPPRPDAHGFQRLSRPSPGAGGAHAADLFVALGPAPPGLPALGRYDAAIHALHPIAADPGRLLREAAASMGQDAAPAGLIVLSARFARVGWKYGDASYPLMLKDAGVLMQTLHLTATALGRGSCLLGGGNSRVFAALTGLDPLQDGPLGEIALTGRLPPPTAEESARDAA